MATDPKSDKLLHAGVKAVAALDPLQQALINKLFGLNSAKACSPEEAAAEFGVELGDIKNMEAEALRMLRGTRNKSKESASSPAAPRGAKRRGTSG